jgi:hypothetical protein
VWRFESSSGHQSEFAVLFSLHFHPNSALPHTSKRIVEPMAVPGTEPSAKTPVCFSIGIEESIMKKTFGLICVLGAAFATVGCTTTERTVTGAAVGGVGGAIVGDAVAGTGGAIVGGVGGAVAGGAIARNM